MGQCSLTPYNHEATSTTPVSSSFEVRESDNLSTSLQIASLQMDLMNSVGKQAHGPRHHHNSEASANPQSCNLIPVDMQAEQRSQAIDRALEEDAKARKNQVNVLPLGAFSMRDIVNQLRNNNEIGLTETELVAYRYNIYQHVITCTKVLVDLIEASGIQLQEDIYDRYSYLCDYIAASHGGAPLNEEFGRAINVLWKAPTIADAFSSAAVADTKESIA